MLGSAKEFSERLNQCLDETGAPSQVRERVLVLSKMLDISKHQAWGFLEGSQLPEPDLAERIASEFEVDINWLIKKK